MTGFDVLIRKRTATSEPAVGIVLESPTNLHKIVDWGDGVPAEEKIGADFVPAVAGSARYLQYVDPKALRAILTDDPARAFALILAEQSGPRTLSQLTASAKGYDLDSALVDAASKKLSKEFGKYPGIVAVGGGRSTRFRWEGTEPPYADVTIESATPLGIDDSLVSGVATVRESTAAFSRRRPQNDLDARKTDSPGAAFSENPKTPLLATQSKLPATVPASESDETLREILEELARSQEVVSVEKARALLPDQLPLTDELLVRALLSEPLSNAAVESIRYQPLQIAIELAERSPKVVEEAHRVSAGTTRQLLHESLLASSARVRVLKDPNFLDWAVSEAAGTLLPGMLAETKRSGGEAKAQLAVRLVKAARRLFSAGSVVTEASDDLLLSLLVEVASQTSRETGELRTRISDQLVRRWKASPGALGTWDERMLERLSRGCEPMPLESGGGRSEILAAVFRTHPDHIANNRWWTGLTFEVLLEHGDGSLSNALRSERVLNRIVQPLIDAELDRVSTRRGAMRILGGSALVASCLDNERVLRLLRDVAGSDSRVAGWVDALRERSTLEKAQSELETVIRAAESAKAAAEEAKNRFEESEAVVDRLTAQLASASNAHSGMREQERRQIQIDVIRSLAQLAALVEGESKKLEPSALIGRVQGFIRRANVRPIGVAGDTASFDPSLHDVPGGRPDDGAPVNVVRSGYKWVTPNEELVVVKAVVTA